MPVENETLAIELEQKGLWRRAATRWLEVMDTSEMDTERDRARKRRNHCLAQLKRPVPEKCDSAGVNRAANATLARMGLDKPDGTAFRLPTSTEEEHIDTLNILV